MPDILTGIIAFGLGAVVSGVWFIVGCVVGYTLKEMGSEAEAEAQEKDEKEDAEKWSKQSKGRSTYHRN